MVIPCHKDLSVVPRSRSPVRSNTCFVKKKIMGGGGAFIFHKHILLFKFQIATGVVFMMTAFLITYTFHCTWVTSEAYSSPSIVLSARSGDGGRLIFDDFREAYYWLRHNTPEVCKIGNNLYTFQIDG